MTQEERQELIDDDLRSDAEFDHYGEDDSEDEEGKEE